MLYIGSLFKRIWQGQILKKNKRFLTNLIDILFGLDFDQVSFFGDFDAPEILFLLERLCGRRSNQYRRSALVAGKIIKCQKTRFGIAR